MKANSIIEKLRSDMEKLAKQSNLFSKHESMPTQPHSRHYMQESALSKSVTAPQQHNKPWSTNREAKIW